MRFICCLLAFTLSGSYAAAGTLQGRVVVEGKIPQLKPRTVAYNPYGYSSKESSTTPSTALPKHLLVYLEGVPGDYKPPKQNARLRQKSKQFVDDIVPVIKGGSVDIVNADVVYHHIRSSTKPWDFNLKKKAPGESVTVPFENKHDKGAQVIPIYCDIHSSMRAHVVLLDNPFYALVLEKGGSFTIKGIPAGTYTLTAFHPTLKVKPLTVTVGKGSAPSKSAVLHMIGEQ